MPSSLKKPCKNFRQNKTSRCRYNNKFNQRRRFGSVEEGRKLLLENIENGKGLEKLKEFVKAQGGDIAPIDNTELLPKAQFVEPVISECDGYITKITPTKEIKEILIEQYKYCDLNYCDKLIKVFYSKDSQNRILFLICY